MLPATIILFATNVVITMGPVLIAPLLPLYAGRLGISGTWIGLVFAADMAARALLMPLCGRWSDKWGRRRFLLGGLALFSLTSMGFAWAETRWDLLFLRVAQGAGAAMVIPVIMAYIGELSPPAREGAMMGTFNISFFAGLAAGPFLSGFLQPRFSLSTPFLLLALLSGLLILWAWMGLPESAARRGERKSSKEGPRWREILRRPRLRGLCLLRALLSFGQATVWGFTPLFAVTGLGLSTFQVGLAVAATTFFTALLISPAGFLADQVDRRRMIFGGSLLAAIAMALIPASSGPALLFLFCSLMGLAWALHMPPAYALMVEEGRKAGMGAALGLYSTSLNLGLAVGPSLSGVLYDQLGIQAPFLLSGALALVGAVLMWALTGAHSKEVERAKDDLGGISTGPIESSHPPPSPLPGVKKGKGLQGS